MAYSIDFRKQVTYMDNGHTYAELKETFGIFPSTLVGWRELLEETGLLEIRAIPGRPPKIDGDSLKQAVKERPDAYVRELAGPYGCSALAVFEALKKYNITYKKICTYAEKSEPKRAEYKACIKKIPVKTRVYIDESGIPKDMRRERGRAPRGSGTGGQTRTPLPPP